MTEPAVQLYKFQHAWILDNSRFKIGKVTRQGGKSFMTSLECVDDDVESGQLWILLSAAERQSRELMQKVKMHLQAYKIAASDIDEDAFPDSADNEWKQLSIHLPNGGRIIGLPANPDTARGYSGNIILDEFAIHRDADAIWKALYPTISRGYKVRVISTPKGLGNRFHRLCTAENKFSKHFVDIHQAIAQGVPFDADELKEGLDDDDAWNQEYLCLFIDDVSSWLTYDLITACHWENLAPEIDYEDFNIRTFKLDTKNPLYMGVDIGRKHDHTIVWIDELVGDVFWNRLILKMAKVKFQVQEDTICDMIQRFGITRTCIDATGIGAQLAEDTKDRFHDRVEEVVFSLDVKNDLATRTKRIYEDRRCRIPVDTKLRDDLHNVKKTVTAAGNVRFNAEQTKDGHSDRFWAQALAFMASEEGAVKPQVLFF